MPLHGAHAATPTCRDLPHAHPSPLLPPMPADIKKAKEGGYHTVESLIMFPRKVRMHGPRACNRMRPHATRGTRLHTCMRWPHPLSTPTKQTRAPRQKLHAVKGLSEAKAEKMIEAARKVTNVGDWQTGTDCMLRVRAPLGAGREWEGLMRAERVEAGGR
jgi:hypothetical protein